MNNGASASVAQAASPPNVDLQTASAYAETLTKPGEFLTLQTFDDSPAKRPHLARILSTCRFKDVAGQLVTSNNAGAGIFITVNETDGRGRATNNVVRVRAVFVDADDLPRPSHWHAEPDFIVWRDDRNWHAYWLVSDMPLDAFAPVQKRIARFYATDPNVHDLPRVMRLPGFLHRKAQPIPVYFQRLRRGTRRQADEVMMGIPVEPRPTTALWPSTPVNIETADQELFERWATRAATEAVIGNRNKCLFQIACEGHGRGLTAETVYTVCLRLANGLAASEINAIVKSAFSKPRTAHLPQPRVRTFTFTAAVTHQPTQEAI